MGAEASGRAVMLADVVGWGKVVTGKWRSSHPGGSSWGVTRVASRDARQLGFPAADPCCLASDVRLQGIPVGSCLRLQGLVGVAGRHVHRQKGPRAQFNGLFAGTGRVFRPLSRPFPKIHGLECLAQLPLPLSPSCLAPQSRIATRQKKEIPNHAPPVSLPLPAPLADLTRSIVRGFLFCWFSCLVGP